MFFQNIVHSSAFTYDTFAPIPRGIWNLVPYHISTEMQFIALFHLQAYSIYFARDRQFGKSFYLHGVVRFAREFQHSFVHQSDEAFHTSLVTHARAVTDKLD